MFKYILVAHLRYLGCVANMSQIYDEKRYTSITINNYLKTKSL
jgi:hypothetical protein